MRYSLLCVLLQGPLDANGACSVRYSDDAGYSRSNGKYEAAGTALSAS